MDGSTAAWTDTRDRWVAADQPWAEFRLLGHLEVGGADAAQAFGGPKQRALLRYSMGLQTLAGEDLDQYLKMSPNASDAEEIKQMSLSIRRMMALRN